MRVDLPLPFAPTITTSCPGSITSEIFLSAGKPVCSPGYENDTFLQALQDEYDLYDGIRARKRLIHPHLNSSAIPFEVSCFESILDEGYVVFPLATPVGVSSVAVYTAFNDAILPRTSFAAKVNNAPVALRLNVDCCKIASDAIEVVPGLLKAFMAQYT